MLLFSREDIGYFVLMTMLFKKLLAHLAYFMFNMVLFDFSARTASNFYKNKSLRRGTIKKENSDYLNYSGAQILIKSLMFIKIFATQLKRLTRQSPYI